MKNRQLVKGFLLLSLFGSVAIFSQDFVPWCCDDDYQKPTITWKGFVNTDVFADTRQVVTKRNGNELLYPKPERLDSKGCDINQRGDFGIIPFAVRLAARLNGPALFCSEKTTAFFSGDFRGVDDEVSPVFRFRKGYINFDWERYSLLVGQTNHPLYVADCRPETVAYSRGAPIDTRARVPQIRVTWHLLDCGYEEQEDEVFCAFYSQSRTAQSKGPEGSSRKYIQNSQMPGLHLQWRRFYESFLCGIGCDFKRITPRLETVDTNLKDDESITSAIFAVYGKYEVPEFVLRGKISYVHDGNEFGFISGYAVHSEDSVTKKRTYTNLRSISCWIDGDLFLGECESDPWSIGAFAGFSKNLGSNDLLYRDPSNGDKQIIFAGAEEIALLLRFSPRMKYNCGPIQWGCEVEWTRAEYGTLADHGDLYKLVPVHNVRFLTNVCYHF